MKVKVLYETNDRLVVEELIVKSKETSEDEVIEILDRFNNTLRPGEFKRNLIGFVQPIKTKKTKIPSVEEVKIDVPIESLSDDEIKEEAIGLSALFSDTFEPKPKKKSKIQESRELIAKSKIKKE